MSNAPSMIKELTLSKVIISLIFTILLWTAVTNAWGYTGLLFNAESGSLTNRVYDFCSRFIWALPAIALLKRYKSDVPVTLTALFKNKPNAKVLIITVAFMVLYNVGAMFVNHGGLWINPGFDLASLFITFSMVAFAEELVYRGWGLNALSAFMSGRKANIIASAFFVLLHLPAYIIKFFLAGTFPLASVAAQCVMVFILGLLFGFLFNKDKSLWSPMIIHFLADFLSVMLIA